jgi:hypothetical protein
MRFRFAAVLIFLTLGVLLAACNMPSQPPLVTQPGDQPVATVPDATLPAITEPPDAARFTIPEAGLSLQLPQGWQVAGPLPANTNTDVSFDLYMLGASPQSSSGPGASLIAVADAGAWTPQQFAQGQCSTCPEGDFQEVTLGGLPALRTEIGGGGVPFTIPWYFVENKGKIIAISILDPQTMAPLDEVLQSIRFE